MGRGYLIEAKPCFELPTVFEEGQLGGCLWVTLPARKIWDLVVLLKPEMSDGRGDRSEDW